MTFKEWFKKQELQEVGTFASGANGGFGSVGPPVPTRLFTSDSNVFIDDAPEQFKKCGPVMCGKKNKHRHK